MIRYYPNLVQGSDEWLAARCGLLTASEMKLIMTPTTHKVASNDKERRHLYELLAQRITHHVEPHYVNDDMLRGQEEEVEARILYSTYYAPVHDMGFITNDSFGFTIGFSPDGLVGNDGIIECKSRRQNYQVETILEAWLSADQEEEKDGDIPDDYILQIQTGLLVSDRKWCDFISYSSGLPMTTIRCFPDFTIQEAILTAASTFERRLLFKLDQYRDALRSGMRLIPTERRMEEEIVL